MFIVVPNEEADATKQEKSRSAHNNITIILVLLH